MDHQEIHSAQRRPAIKAFSLLKAPGILVCKDHSQWEGMIMIMNTSDRTKYWASAAVLAPSSAPVSTLLDWLRMLGIFLALLLALSILTLVTCRCRYTFRISEISKQPSLNCLIHFYSRVIQVIV